MGRQEALATINCLLIYRIYDDGYSPREIWYYEKPFDLGKNSLPSDRSVIAEFVEKRVLSYFSSAIDNLKISKDWIRNFSVTERQIAELVLAGQVHPFKLKYYSVGYDDSIRAPTTPTVNRIASFFAYDDNASRKPLLSGYLDYPDPVPQKRVEEFFKLDKADSAHKKVWNDWANRSFSTIYTINPLLRITIGYDNYVVLHTGAELAPYPEGFMIGSIPFGREKKPLALCDVNADLAWAQTLDDHKKVFSRWNLVCQTAKLQRVFIEGEPGAGKELWYEAIRGGVEGRMTGKNWQTLSAALCDSDLRKLLCGQRDGNLERPGYLSTCENGGIFLDEIGKSSTAFRSLLLRVLESKEYVPDGGTPAKFNNILFIFASTPQDTVDAFAPPDFWTRMDVQLKLPHPIRLDLSRKRRLSAKDRARFYSLFATFWFSDPLKSIASCTEGGQITSAPEARKDFTALIFDPLIDEIDKFNPKPDLLKGIRSASLTAIPVSPRRVSNLAASLVNKYRWLGSALKSTDIPSRAAKRSWTDLLTILVEGFMEQVISDEKNRRAAKKKKKTPLTTSTPT